MLVRDELIGGRTEKRLTLVNVVKNNFYLGGKTQERLTLKILDCDTGWSIE